MYAGVVHVGVGEVKTVYWDFNSQSIALRKVLAQQTKHHRFRNISQMNLHFAGFQYLFNMLKSSLLLVLRLLREPLKIVGGRGSC